MDPFETLHTYCNHNDDAIMMMMMELELILTELRPFKLSHFRQCLHCVGYGVCVVNSSYSFQWLLLKPCVLLVDIMICMWVFDETRVNFDRIMASQT